MGVPYFQIKDILKDSKAACFSSNFTLYRDVSDRVFGVLRQLVAEIEIYSIDEAFFTISADNRDHAFAQACSIKRLVEQRVGIPVSIGVAPSKTLAKLANDTAKKERASGVFVFDSGDSAELVSARLLTEVWGVGTKLSRRYAGHGIVTIGDFLATASSRVEAIGGVVGLRTHAELSGRIAYPLTLRSTLPKSIASTRSFGAKTNDKSAIKDALAYHVRHVATDLRRDGLVAGAVTVVLLTARHGDWVLRGGGKSATFPVPVDDTTTLLQTALSLLDSLYESGVPYNKTGVILSQLVPSVAVPHSLFTTPQVDNNRTLDSLVDSLNTRFGIDRVRRGVFLQTPTWRSRQETLSPAYTTNWRELPIVKAN